MTNTNTGKRITWHGDMANAPKSGTVVADDGGWMIIKWDEGRSERAPSALARSARWTVAA